METLLDALQEGRVFELPESDKVQALRFLAHVIEAFPDVPPETDVFERVLAREQATNTALGRGWACPHARLAPEGDLSCVVGWSPTGIDYGASDGAPVVMIIMYLVPANQRNHYLREVSVLAKALATQPHMEELREATDLNDVRNYLLNLIAASKETVGPDARARMIQLQARGPEAPPLHDLSDLLVEPVTLVAGPGIKPVALTNDAGLTEWLESSSGVVERLEAEGTYRNGGWHLVRRNMVTYQGGRVVYECLALRITARDAASSGRMKGPAPRR